MSKVEAFVFGVAVGQILALAIMLITQSLWFNRFVLRLRQDIVLFRLNRATKRLNATQRHIERLYRV